MIIGPMPAAKVPQISPIDKGNRFKNILVKKQESFADNKNSILKNFNEALVEMQKTGNIIEKVQNKSAYSPDKLVQWQFHTGHSLLKVQMFCRIAEQAATTLKNFTQMQV